MADTRRYNAQHLSRDNTTQAQMTNWYEICIPGLNHLTIMVRNATLPEESNPAVELPFGNSKAKVAGQVEYGEGTMSFMDAIRKDTEAEIIKWRKKVYNPETGKMGWVEDYKKDVSVTQYGPDGTYEREWTFKGAWPTSVNYGEMSGESSDAKIIQVTLAYDSAVRSDT